MVTATRAIKGFNVVCPHCHSADSVNLNLNSLATCRCGECDEEFSPHEARDMVARELAHWDQVCHWVEMAQTIM